jgi:hypothetical protein
VLAWKRGIAVLTAGPVKVTPDPRVRLLPSPVSSSSLPGIPELSGGGYSLELKDVRPQDAGDYACQMGTMEPREIIHTLEILGEDMLFVFMFENYELLLWSFLVYVIYLLLNCRAVLSGTLKSH